ncbi:hypothetical protein R3P38DRAFT_3548264 [Favolaschia claudopus]|uniref:Uncharacterized protein n=1 Tax=Favolaschia claudopus TaxID=2862362 RepID=A0AAW0B650_9AGAR
MTSKPRVKPTSKPQILVLSTPDGDLNYQTRYIPNRRTHVVDCDLCGTDVTAGAAGSSDYRLGLHRTACLSEQLKEKSKQARLAEKQQQVQDPLILSESTPQESLESGFETPSGATTPRPSSPVENLSLDPTQSELESETYNDPEPVLEEGKGCPGIGVKWTTGSVWGDYPYILHESPDIGWEPISFDSQTNTIYFRSDQCKRSSEGDSAKVCRPCAELPSTRAFVNVQERAKEVKSHTNLRYLTSRQKDALILKLFRHVALLENQLHSNQRSNKRQKNQISDYKRILALIASEELAGLRRILEQALARGSSPRKVLAILERTLRKLYHVRGGFNERELDISFLVKAIGGPKLLYALQKALGLASVSTIRRRHRVPKLLPSLATPTPEEVHANIQAFFSPDIKPPPSFPNCSELPGNIMMFDGVALEGRPRYCPDRDAILGLCREHSNRVNLKVDSLESVEQVRKALGETDKKSTTRVCYGCDATVVAIAPYANEKHYTAVPIVASPTDKTETGLQFAEWLKTVLEAWRTDPNGEKMYGPIWSIESDGDGVFRLAKFTICMQQEVDPDSPLGKILAQCLGINKYTSKHGVIPGSDLKHVAKRFATLTRHMLGIAIGDTVLKPTDVIKHLTMLPNITLETAKALLDPADKQNVPKAITLVQRMHQLRELDTPQNPSDRKIRHAIDFFAEFEGYLIFPFIDVKQSLSQQIRSLSTYSHLCTAMYLKHQTNFLTNPLFADSQLIVRCIVITTARLQILDPKLKFYIILDGTDRLEGVFCDTRTIDHASNFDIYQLSQKIATGTLINSTFQKNPDLDRGHRKLKLSGALGIDHINPASWLGDVVVGHVNIPQEWELGRKDADAVLAKYFNGDIAVDWEELFIDSAWDHLRPLGEYVGTSFSPTDARSEMENERFPIVEPVDPTATSLSSEQVNRTLIEADEGPQQTAESLGLDLDNYFPENLDDLDAENIPDIVQKCLTDKAGKKYLKSTLIAGLASNRSKKSTLRTQRVQGMAIADFHQKRLDIDFDPLEEEDMVKIDDLVGVLVKTKEEICLCALLIKEFKKENQTTPLSAIHLDEQENPDLGITIIGQLMDMTQSPQKDTWHWNRKFLVLDSSEGAPQTKNRQLLLHVPSSEVYPLAPDISQADDIERSTWTITSSQLEETKHFAWEMLDPDSDDIATRINNLPEVKNLSVPYRTVDGDKSFCVNIPSHVRLTPKLDAKEMVACKLCHATMKLNVMRNHVGTHILFAMRDKHDPKLPPDTVIAAEPCGWCGLEGECHTQLTSSSKKNSTTVQITSNCSYHYAKMMYKAAKTFSEAAPCTNVPLQCPLCPISKSGNRKTIWKYNALFHLLAEHSRSGQIPPNLSPQFWVETHIRHIEEQALGITVDETDRFRDENTIPNSDAIDGWEAYPDEVLTPHASPEKKGRERSTKEHAWGKNKRRETPQNASEVED